MIFSFLLLTLVVVVGGAGILASLNDLSILFLWELCFPAATPIEFPVFFDSTSLLFIATVAVISRAVLIFSIDYMAAEKFFSRFHILVATFIFSILLLILRPNLISILIGWDGLGVSSYLLVIYFNRTKSFNAGILTALSNRVGDCLILIAISLVFSLPS